MSIEGISSYDSLLQTAASTSGTETSSNLSLTSEDFLMLLVTELQYQDPTEPVDNSEMVDQMTQYSQLEEMTEMNENMQAMTDYMGTMTGLSGLDYLGREVEADGSTVAKSGDDVSTLTFEVSDDADSLTVNIYDENGSLVDTETYEQVDAGTKTYEWDGQDAQGNSMADGNYTVLISAEEADGTPVDVTTSTSGTVTAVSNTDEGVMLTLEDGRTVNMLDVTYTQA